MEEKTMENRVRLVEPYKEANLGALDENIPMLLRQYQFPDTFSNEDKLVWHDSDRFLDSGSGFRHADSCYRKYIGVGAHDIRLAQMFGSWARSANDEKIMEFMMEIMEVEKMAKWTGYRITGRVLNNGHAMFSLALFAKHPKSETKVYSGGDAPNVRKKIADSVV